MSGSGFPRRGLVQRGTFGSCGRFAVFYTQGSRVPSRKYVLLQASSEHSSMKKTRAEETLAREVKAGELAMWKLKSGSEDELHKMGTCCKCQAMSLPKTVRQPQAGWARSRLWPFLLCSSQEERSIINIMRKGCQPERKGPGRVSPRLLGPAWGVEL